MPESRRLLSPAELSRELGELAGWQIAGKAITKTYTFPDYAHAVLFAVSVAHIAEKLDHHPDLVLSWGKVVVRTWTHTTDGITPLDVMLAKGIEAL